MKKVIITLPKLLMSALIFGSIVVKSAQAQTVGDTLQASAIIPTTDTAFISKNIMDNVMEIQLSTLGLKNGSSPAVKKIAGTMIKDHSMILAALKTAARKKNMTVPEGASMSGMSGMSGMNSPVPDLSTVTGAAFDSAWITQMLLMHNNKVTELKTTINGTTFGPEVKVLARTALTKIQAHQQVLAGLSTSNK